MNGYSSPGNYKGNPNLLREQGHDIFRNMSWNRYGVRCVMVFESENVLANKLAHFMEQYLPLFFFLMITY